jgi:adenosylcobyric acid synthase
MDAQVRSQLRGFVLNRFRGDAALLAPGPELLQQRTGVPTLAVIPLLRDHGLPEEDAVPGDSCNDAGHRGPRVVVLATPHASNLDEFEPLRAAGVALQFSRDAATLARADWLILPGSKHSRADLAWVRGQGLEAVVHAHVAAGRPLLAVCGGLQWLGQAIDDPLGLEGGRPGQDQGLGLLPLRTRFAPAKQLGAVQLRLGALTGPWSVLSGLDLSGYEIHHGQTTALSASLVDVLPGRPGLAWQQGPVLALYLHGLFENPTVVRALFGRQAPPLDAVFERLADTLDDCFAPGALMALLQPTVT